jgi:hypothetical protein
MTSLENKLVYMHNSNTKRFFQVAHFISQSLLDEKKDPRRELNEKAVFARLYFAYALGKPSQGLAFIWGI